MLLFYLIVDSCNSLCYKYIRQGEYVSRGSGHILSIFIWRPDTKVVSFQVIVRDNLVSYSIEKN